MVYVDMSDVMAEFLSSDLYLIPTNLCSNLVKQNYCKIPYLGLDQNRLYNTPLALSVLRKAATYPSPRMLRVMDLRS